MPSGFQPGRLDRHITLDVLRGFGVMGILAMNIIAFAMPEWAYITPQAYGGETLADRITWFVSFVLVDGKMRGIFSLLFGASMMLIIERAQAKGDDPAKVHFSRMAWLAVIGLLHYFFVWFGDILFLYAAVGSLAYLFRDWEPRRLIKTALIIMGLSIIIWAVQFGGLQFLQMAAQAPGASADMVTEFREIIDSVDFDYSIAEQLTLHRGPYWPIAAEKLADFTAPFVSVLQSTGETLPLMMLGMALQKNGFLTGNQDRDVYVLWAKWLVPIGLVLSTALALWVVAADYDRITSLAVFMVWSTVPRLMLTIGYAALLIIWIGRNTNRPVTARIAAAGQAAFTNYLGTSIIMTTLFYGYGLGLYGHISRFGLLPFVIGAWAVMLLWSKPWLDRYRFGPMEWVWRSLARGALQPMQRL
jgi:uncharacterized protein